MGLMGQMGPMRPMSLIGPICPISCKLRLGRGGLVERDHVLDVDIVVVLGQAALALPLQATLRLQLLTLAPGDFSLALLKCCG